MMSTHIDKSSDRIHTVQAERDLEANWDVDLARKLEDYLLKICSGEISGTEDDAAHISINFAEAALLLQGSVQVYSRKVEYLYNLVLHALDFLSEKRQQGELEGLTEQPEKAASRCGNDDGDDQFWGLDDIPVEPRNCLDTSTSRDALFYNFTKPPANLVVLEADCLDTSGDGGELESYLLASSDLYRDFILLDPCDAPSVNNFLEEGGTGVGTSYRGSSTHKGIHSSRKRTGATGRRSSLGKNHDAPLNQSPIPDCGLQDDKCDVNPGPSKDVNFEGCSQRFDMDDMYSPPGNLDDTDLDEDETDPWKPLNPHEPGDLKVKPFKRVSLRKHVGNTPTLTSIAALFPLAKMHHGPISSELKDMWDLRQNSCNEHKNSQSDPAPLYEKLRESLASGGKNNGGFIPHSNNDDWVNENDNGVPAEPYGEMPESSFMDEDLPLPHDKDFDSASRFDADDPFGQREPSSQTSLEDLCRSHLDALLANIAETEKQTELAARVSSWKQKIEQNLEVQDSRPAFDIHAYGERIIDRLSVQSDRENISSFADIVRDQEKHEIARTFSAMLQLVNNGDIDLDKNGVNGNSVCYTAASPFRIRLLKKDGRGDDRRFKMSKKRVRSPFRKKHKDLEDKIPSDGSPITKSPSENGSSLVTTRSNSKLAAKLPKVGGLRCTPEGKRRRSRIVEPVDLHPAG